MTGDITKNVETTRDFDLLKLDCIEIDFTSESGKEDWSSYLRQLELEIKLWDTKYALAEKKREITDLIESMEPEAKNGIGKESSESNQSDSTD